MKNDQTHPEESEVIASMESIVETLKRLTSEVSESAEKSFGPTVARMIEGTLVESLVCGSFGSGFFQDNLDPVLSRGLTKTRESLGFFVFSVVGETWAKETIRLCHKAGEEASEANDSYRRFIETIRPSQTEEAASA